MFFEQSRAEQSRAEQSRAEQSRIIPALTRIILTKYPEIFNGEVVKIAEDQRIAFLQKALENGRLPLSTLLFYTKIHGDPLLEKCAKTIANTIRAMPYEYENADSEYMAMSVAERIESHELIKICDSFSNSKDASTSASTSTARPF